MSSPTMEQRKKALAMRCERCQKDLDPNSTINVVVCKTCGNPGYLCRDCKRKHPKIHEHRTPLHLVRRETLLSDQENA